MRAVKQLCVCVYVFLMSRHRHYYRPLYNMDVAYHMKKLTSNKNFWVYNTIITCSGALFWVIRLPLSWLLWPSFAYEQPLAVT